MGDPAPLLKRAKSALLAEGFKENGSVASWHRFTKGDQEVVVYDSGVYSFDSSGKAEKAPLVHGQPTSPHTQCVLVKNGPGTHDSLTIFKIKKALRGW